MLSIKHFRFLAMAILAALAVTLAVALPGVSADGGEDKAAPIPRSGETTVDNQAPPIPEKAELNYPNLGSHLDQLVASVEAGQATAQGAASNSPLYSGELVAVTIHLSGNVDDVVQFLDDHGGDPRNVGEDYIEAYVPVTLLGRLSEQPGVIRVREIVPPQPGQSAQRIAGHGPAAHLSRAWNQAGYSGQGVKVGIIDTGFKGFSDLIGTELPEPAGVMCFTGMGRFTNNMADCETGKADNDHGTIVAESLMDIAPQVNLYIGHPVTRGDLQAIADWMVSEGVSVINYSVVWPFDGPGDGTSPLSISPLNTVDRAVTGGAIWITAAGNQARRTWFARAPFLDQDSDGFIEFAARDEVNEMTLEAGDRILVQLRWDDKWGGASTDLDLGIQDNVAGRISALSRDPQTGAAGHFPSESLIYTVPVSSSYGVVVEHVNGSVPDWIQLMVQGGPEIERHTRNGSIRNPAESANPGMLAVGAAYWDDVYAIGHNSSRGPTPDGRVKPDVVGAHCGATALRPLNEYNSGFCGTSQASPHVAGMAALVRQRFPSYTPAEVASYLKDNAEQRQSPDPNDTWGYGFAKLPPPDGTAPPVPAPSNVFTRNPAADFNTLVGASNWAPQGIWSDGETMWVADIRFRNAKIYAYNLATKARVPGKDFDTLQAAGNTGPVGIWSDGTTMWVSDLLGAKIYAYNLATKARVPGKDFDTLQAAGNTGPVGIWSDGTTMWVSDLLGAKIYAYNLATKARVPGKDFNTLTATRNRTPEGIWSDGMTMWVADSGRDKIFAYDMDTKARVPGREFNTLDASGNWMPGGIWSDGTTMWVSDLEDNKIYAYRMRKAVVFGDLNWTSALLQTEIARHMVEHGYGYATEKVLGSTIPLLQDLRDGDIHLLMEVWLPSWSEQWEAALSAGNIVDLGTSLGNDWQSAFVIPSYLQEQYPGLDHVEDLKQQEYRSLFSTAETGGKARLVSCVVGWICEEVNRQQIEGYGLQDHVHIINPDTAAALNESLKGAYENEEPWLGYQWGTNEPALLLDLVRLEEPAYSDECWSTDRACAYEDDTILIGAHSSLAELAPDVVDFLEQWDFSVDVHLRYATMWMDANPEASIEEAALNWLTDNVDTWNAWVTEDAAAGILATLPEVPADLAALVALYNATGGPNWTNNTNWLTSAPMAQWHGVTVDANGRVASLSLPENGLTGKIPVELGNLTGLTVLNLNENQLGGEIPGELGSLTNLTGLHITNNQLSGGIPLELPRLTRLETLALGGNQLTGTIPARLGDLTDLEELSLRGNQLTGEIPEELGKLAELTVLSLSRNDLTGDIPTELGELTNLARLFLNDNQLAGSIPPTLSNLAKLEELDLDDNQLTGPVPARLSNLTSLEKLYLTKNQLAGPIPPELGGLVNLSILALGDNRLTGEIPGRLGDLTNLTGLYLWGNQLTGEIPTELSTLANLKIMDLSDNQLTGEIPESLTGINGLTSFSFYSNSGLCAPVDSAFQGWLDSIADAIGSSCATADSAEDRAVLAELHQAAGGIGWGNSANWLSDRPLREWHGVANDASGRVTGLFLFGNQLTGTIPMELGNLASLEWLVLYQNQLTGKIPPELGKLARLEWLWLFNNQLAGEIPADLGNLTNLASLRLDGNRLTGTIPAELGGLTNLTVLYLAGNQLTGCVPAGLMDVERSDFAQIGLDFCTSGIYDRDNDGVISITELFDAIDDYFAGVISITELFDVIDAYFGG